MKKYNKEEALKILHSNKIIQELIEKFKTEPTKYSWQAAATPRLVGGSVVDILEGRIPKDYDIKTNLPTDEIIKKGFKFIRETATATTFEWEDGNGIIQTLQTLRNDIYDFDYKISQSSFNIAKGSEVLTVDEVSFNNKTLIPLDFINKNLVLDSLKRIPHWKKKGYTMDDLTYLSLLRALGTAGGGVS